MLDVDDRDTFIRKADHFLAQGAFAEALNLAEERLESCPYDLEAIMVVCQSWLGLNHLAEAEKALTALERAHSRMASLYKALGDACLKEGRRQDAVAYFKKGLTLLPETFAPSQLSQMMTDVMGPLDESVPVHETTREEPVLDADFYTMTMADLYVKQGHLQSAVDILDVIRRREPDNEAVIRRLRDVKALMTDQPTEPSGSGSSGVLTELSRWLKNIDRMRSHDRSIHPHA